MSDSTFPEMPPALLDQVLAGWSLHLSANGGSLAQTKAAEIAIRETLAYARDQAKEIVTINGNEYKVGEWDLRDPGLGPDEDWPWTLYATRVPADAPEEG
ncbi:hypothetical protein ACIBQX_11540 [Nonomuraea sp. NPDC049714]|uniref:hypothetical protein n=1 Tax=Nonomuraea sp. NPDC049714 TaxID=3364357 RepID=UPI00378EBB91